MSVRRFKVDSLDGQVVTLSGGEARHAARVLRVAVGDAVELTDGRGSAAAGRVRAVRGDAVEVEILRRETARPVANPLTLAVALPKGERADWLIEKCAELGVAALRPLITERSVVRPGATRIERWQRKCTAAAKQSGAPREMSVLPAVALAAVMEEARAYQFFGLADPDAQSALIDAIDARVGAGLMVVGPEGGLTDKERTALLSRGARAVRLGPAILRIETAAIAVAAIWNSKCGG